MAALIQDSALFGRKSPLPRSTDSPVLGALGGASRFLHTRHLYLSDEEFQSLFGMMQAVAFVELSC
eukprot:4662622-Amphidinium_carterae.1